MHLPSFLFVSSTSFTARISDPRLLLGLAMALVVTAATGQTLTIDGPSAGTANTLLEFEASAVGCNPTEGQYFWQVGDGLIAGVASNRIIQVSWATAGDKTLTVFHTDCLGAFAEANVTITAPGTITLGATSFMVDEGAGQVQVSVLRQNGSQGAAQVDYATADGTAIATDDYTNSSGTLSWSDGDTSNRLIAIPITGDAVFEDDESFFVAVSNVQGAALGSVVEARIDVIDNDPPPGDVVQFSQALYQPTEDAGTATFTLTRTGTSAGAISVDVASINNTASAPDDFAAVATTVNWAAGDSADKLVITTIVDDTLEEGTEIADLVLTNPQPSGTVFLGGNDLSQLVILDDDVTAGSISFDTASVEVNEEAGPVTLTIERIGGSSGDVQVALTVTGGSATLLDDFELSQTSVFFAGGDSQPKSVDVSIINDELLEGVETIRIAVSLVSGEAVIGNPNVVTVRINDDDIGPPDTLRFNGVLTSGEHTVAESAGIIQLGVERNGLFFGEASVTVTASSGTATIGQDLGPVNQQLQWANGEGGTKTFAVTVVDDGLIESTEDATLALTSPEGATLGTPTVATLRISDNDIGTVGFTTTFLSLAEPDGTGVLVVERAGAASLPATVDVTVSGSAEQSVDFTVSATSLSWTANEIGPKEITVTILDDAVADPAETIVLTLTNVAGADLGEPQAQVLITDDDFSLPSAAFQTVDQIVGPRSAVRPGPKNEGSVVQVWLDRAGSLAGEEDEIFIRTSRTTFMAGLGPLSAALPDLDFNRNGELLLLTAADSGSLKLSCLDLDIEPALSCGEASVFGGPVLPSELRLSAATDGTVAVAWIKAGAAQLRLFAQDLTPITDTIDLGAANRVELTTSPLGTTAVAWLDRSMGTAIIRTLRDDGSQVAENSVPVSTPGAEITDVDLAFNGEGTLTVASTELSGSTSSAVQLRVFDRELTSLGPVLEVGRDATDVEVFANGGGDLVLAITSDQAGAGSEVVLIAAGTSIGPSFPFEGQATAPAATDHDLIQFTVASASVPASVTTNFEVFEIDFPLSAGVCGTTLSGRTAPLCLTEQRFEVTVQWQDFGGTIGNATAVPLTTDSGYLWFFQDDNVEVVLKVLDACSFTNGFWLFVTGLTNTEVHLLVDDVVAGVTRSLFNPLFDDFQPTLEINSFIDCGINAGTGTPPLRITHASGPPAATSLVAQVHLSPKQDLLAAQQHTGTCVPDSETLCLSGGRFQVTIDWATDQGTSGRGQAEALTPDTGTFTFFDPTNVEIVIKVLNACSFNNRFWVFAGGLTNVETSMTVTDTLTGIVNTYQNPQGEDFIPILSVDAFDTCDG